MKNWHCRQSVKIMWQCLFKTMITMATLVNSTWDHRVKMVKANYRESEWFLTLAQLTLGSCPPKPCQVTTIQILTWSSHLIQNFRWVAHSLSLMKQIEILSELPSEVAIWRAISLKISARLAIFQKMQTLQPSLSSTHTLLAWSPSRHASTIPSTPS